MPSEIGDGVKRRGVQRTRRMSKRLQENLPSSVSHDSPALRNSEVRLGTRQLWHKHTAGVHPGKDAPPRKYLTVLSSGKAGCCEALSLSTEAGTGINVPASSSIDLASLRYSADWLRYIGDAAARDRVPAEVSGGGGHWGPFSGRLPSTANESREGTEWMGTCVITRCAPYRPRKRNLAWLK